MTQDHTPERTSLKLSFVWRSEATGLPRLAQTEFEHVDLHNASGKREARRRARNHVSPGGMDVGDVAEYPWREGMKSLSYCLVRAVRLGTEGLVCEGTPALPLFNYLSRPGQPRPWATNVFGYNDKLDNLCRVLFSWRGSLKWPTVTLNERELPHEAIQVHCDELQITGVPLGLEFLEEGLRAGLEGEPDPRLRVRWSEWLTSRSNSQFGKKTSKQTFTIADIERIERVSSTIWVITSDFYWDLDHDFSEVVSQNIKLGKKYHYMYPVSQQAQADRIRVRHQITPKSEQVKFTPIEDEWFLLVHHEIVIYDADSSSRRGFLIDLLNDRTVQTFDVELNERDLAYYISEISHIINLHN